MIPDQTREAWAVANVLQARLVIENQVLRNIIGSLEEPTEVQIQVSKGWRDVLVYSGLRLLAWCMVVVREDDEEGGEIDG